MKFTKLLLSVLAIVFSTIVLNAQTLYEMEMSEKDGTWQSYSGGTYITTGDDGTGRFNLPFTFRLDNQNFTWGYANCNGYLTLGYRSTNITATPGYYRNGYNAVAWCNRDLFTHNGVYMHIHGSAPNRVATIQWNRVRIPYNRGNHYVNAQIKLYETSNKIEIIYGPQSGTPYNYSCRAWIGGHYVRNYGPAWCIRPGSPSQFIKGYPTPESGWSSYWYNNTAWRNYLPEGKTYIYGKSDPELVGIYPAGGEVFRKGAQYGGSDPQQHPAVFISRDDGQADILLTYQISGPVSNSVPTVIYRAHQGPGNYEVDPGDIQGDPVRYDFRAGIGPCFGIGGILDLQSNQGSFESGEYQIDASIIIDEIGTVNYEPVLFNIALPYDISVTKIQRPRSKYEKKYPIGEVPLIVKVMNIGLNSITNFQVDLNIYHKDGHQIIATKTEVWENTADVLESAEDVDINLGSFYPDEVGDYRLEASVTLLSATDQQISNNIFPRVGEVDYVFTVAKEVDIRAIEIVYPTTEDEIVVGRPINPIARFTNQGVNDLDFDSIFYEITYNPNSEVVFRDTIVNYVISAGANFDTTDVRTEKNFVPPYLGAYTICATIYSPYDNNPLSMRIACGTFESNAGLIGTYTIGSGGNFETIQDAVDELYQYGVGGNVIFELKDRGPYEIGDLYDDKIPALDLSSYIHGVGPNATVTFMPSEDRSVERGGNNSGVTINVSTGSGMGILLGQNLEPNNSNAIVLNVPPSQKSKYANSNGYITFDGGQNKSIRFVMKTATDHEVYSHNVFYLKEGASNNAIENCIFENDYTDDMGNPLTPHVFIPKVKTMGSEVVFMDNEWNEETGFSSAIVLISRAPMDKDEANMLYNLDTLTASNNEISGNEISGFGYGVVDRGAGALLRTGHDEWVKYYNHNNIISNNIIHNVSRAGIFLGYTTDDKVTGNRIYNVDGRGAYTFVQEDVMMGKSDKSQDVTPIIPEFPDAGGIIAGGDAFETWYGFNNIDLTISGNEISGIESDYVAYGIKVEQSQTEYQHSPTSYFPDAAENSRVINNIIWGIETNDDVSRVGI
ncbi:hypothetical protein ACFLSQ_10635, partial [Bacteroidota bacterium]